MGAIITYSFSSAKFCIKQPFTQKTVEMVPVLLIVDNSKWFY